MLKQITDGCGIEFKVLVNGKIETFKLHLISRYNKFWKTNTYSFLFVNNDKTLCSDSSCYSGGATGFGKHTNEIKDLEDFLHLNDAIMITDDIEEINIIAKQEEQRIKAEKEAFIEKQTERTNKINELPTSFSTGIDYIDEHYEFYRGEAFYNHFQNSSIKGGFIHLHKKGSDKFCYIDLKNFITKDERIKAKDFVASLGIGIKTDPKKLFACLKTRQEEIEKQIRDIKNN